MGTGNENEISIAQVVRVKLQKKMLHIPLSPAPIGPNLHFFTVAKRHAAVIFSVWLRWKIVR